MGGLLYFFIFIHPEAMSIGWSVHAQLFSAWLSILKIRFGADISDACVFFDILAGIKGCLNSRIHESAILRQIRRTNEEDRHFAISKILEIIKDKNFGNAIVRPFVTAPLNWDATSNLNVHDWPNWLGVFLWTSYHLLYDIRWVLEVYCRPS